MSVTLSSDLLVGVMNAAPESKLRQVTARLEALDKQWVVAQRGITTAANPSTESVQQGGDSPKVVAQAFKDFEGMLLRNMLESMLPATDSGLYGDGIAGGIWRSMAADQFANLYAGQGGVGVASMLTESVPAVASQAESQWPFFPTVETANFAS